MIWWYESNDYKWNKDNYSIVCIDSIDIPSLTFKGIIAKCLAYAHL